MPGVGWLRALGARSGGTRRAAVGLAPRLPGRTVPRGAVGKANATSSRRAPPGQARALMCAPAIVLTTASPSGAPPPAQGAPSRACSSSPTRTSSSSALGFRKSAAGLCGVGLWMRQTQRDGAGRRGARGRVRWVEHSRRRGCVAGGGGAWLRSIDVDAIEPAVAGDAPLEFEGHLLHVSEHGSALLGLPSKAIGQVGVGRRRLTGGIDLANCPEASRPSRPAKRSSATTA